MNAVTGHQQYSIIFDWGTTNLRAYLVDSGGRMIDRYSAKLGAKYISQNDYAAIIRRVSGKWGKQYDVDGIVLAGMVGGNLGWHDVPMVESPAGIEEVAAGMARFDVAEMPPVRIIPGVFCRSGAGLPGMMRGEEVQILGALAIRQSSAGYFSLPGTHTKWAQVRDGKIVGIVTSMTGEMFDLIRSYSVLAKALKGWNGQIDAAAFRNGLEIAGSGLGALQCIFVTRAQQVIGEERDLGRRASRLSGILIGSEVLAMLTSRMLDESGDIVLVCETGLAELYAGAVRFFGRTSVSVDSTSSFVTGALLLLRAASRVALPA